jgi:hypothetical protein
MARLKPCPFKARFMQSALVLHAFTHPVLVLRAYFDGPF